MTFVLGLTGSIGMGKSTTASMFAGCGVPVHDADEAVHALYAGAAAPLIEAAFPGTVREGAVDRALLAARVLGDAEALGRLEGIVHPLVREAEAMLGPRIGRFVFGRGTETWADALRQRLGGRTVASAECGTSGAFTAEQQTWSGRAIDVPSCFISGRQDWGIYQRPGAIEAMQSTACSDLRGIHLINGAGHWVQQEQPSEVSRLLLEFVGAGKAAKG